MAILIGDTAPDFTADSTEGPIHFYDYIDGHWAVLFSHPKNFTPVCTTELGYTAKLKPEFDKRGVKVLGLSVDKLEDHGGWAKDIEETQGQALNFPLLADTKGEVARARLRLAPPISLADVPMQEEFAVIVTRRGADGTHEPVAIVDDEALVERAIRRAV